MTPPAPTPARGLLLTILLLTMLEFLQAGMIAFAAGPIMGEIGAAPEEFSLATACYACVAILTIAMQRWLVERSGWRHFVQASLLLFIIGSAICASCDTFRGFLLGRMVMALGGAAFMTSGRILVNLIPPSPMRFIGIKYFATGLAGGIAFAPGLAALAVAYANWNLIFVLLALLAATTAALATQVLPASLVAEELRTQSHPALFMSLASGSFLLLYLIQRAQFDFFSDAALLAAGAGVGAVALAYFFQALLHHERPLLHLRPLRHPSYIGGVMLFALCYLLLGANNYMLPMLMQRTLGYAWQTVGQFQTLGLLSMLASWALMSWLLPRFPGAKKFFVIGFIALSVFGWQLSRLNTEANLWRDLLPALACNGVFLIFVMATTAMQTFRDVQHHETVFSHAQQLKNMMAQFGMALGIASSTLFQQWRTAEHYSMLNARYNSGAEIYQHLLQQLAETLAGSGPPALPQAAALLAQQLAQQAALLACLDYFTTIACIGLACALLMAVQRRMT